MRVFSFLALAITAVAGGSLPGQVASAQDYTSGFGFGLGFDIGRQTADFSGFRRHCNPAFFGSWGPTPRFEEPPYFAKFPPVYYSGIVMRPYGVSPFAAPPGILPIEQTMPVPELITNPYFPTPNAAPDSQEAKPADGSQPGDDHQTSVENYSQYSPDAVAIGD